MTGSDSEDLDPINNSQTLIRTSTPIRQSLKMEVKVTLQDVYNIVPEFGGSPSELDKFISCGNLLFCSTQKQEEQKMFLDIIKTRLKDAAFELVQYKTIKTWDELVQELQKNFKEEISRNSAQNNLIHTKQNFKESIKEYGERLILLLKTLNSATFTSTENSSIRDFLIKENEKLAIQTFEDGIRNPNLKILVKDRGESTLKSEIQYATVQTERVDKFYQTSQNFKQNTFLQKSVELQ